MTGADLATKVEMVSVWIQYNEIPHPVGLVGRFHFHDGAVLLYLLKKTKIEHRKSITCPVASSGPVSPAARTESTVIDV